MLCNPLEPIPSCVIHQKNLPHCLFSMQKDIKIHQPRPELEGVSKNTLIVKQPVFEAIGSTLSSMKAFMMANNPHRVI